ncbi:LCP family glycopolymer transferase [Demequina activiva]|uniref:Transcriptional regulator n=1 Tax=Demequina activiva TaxID=1582364 RepID=A0A919Q568_9MICO|nr:LCP family protein [Demequina activiva]GIG55382.1 transcriptional regulator [Demequina activiva]
MASRRRALARHASHAPRHRALTVMGTAVAAILGFTVVAGASYALLAQGALDRQDIGALTAPTNAEGEPQEAAEPTDFAAGEPINILLIGSDERNGQNGNIGGFVTDGMRGDTTMVMHISGDRTRIDVMSIPRDLRVRISDCQLFDGSVVPGWTGKFNIAFANGGVNGDRAEAAACAMRTVTDFTGIEFNNHYVVIDFAGFIGMIDALDGVPMCIPQDMSSSKANLELEAGPQVLDGTTALAFARARTGVGLGDGTDLMRIDRQHELLTNTARKALGMNLLTDVPELTQFMRAGAESLTLDPQLGSITNLAGLAYHLRGFDTSNLTFTTVPWSYAGDGSGDVVMNEYEAQQMFQSIVDDVPLPGEEPEAEPSQTPSADPSGEPSAAPTISATPSSTPVPSPTATEPLRETQAEILASCEVP